MLVLVSLKPMEIDAVVYEKSFIEMYKVSEVQQTKNYHTRIDVNLAILKLDRAKVINFYNQFVNDIEITTVILDKALTKGVPVNTIFAVAWKESKFNPKSVSKKNTNGSRDWGLFQLNDGVYKWTREDFLNVSKNTDTAMDHLLYCLKETSDMGSALAAYNAGVHRILTRGAPSSTELHVVDILEYEDFLNREFNEFIKRKK